MEYFVLILRHLQGKMNIFLLLGLFLYAHTKIVPGSNKLFAGIWVKLRMASIEYQ